MSGIRGASIWTSDLTVPNALVTGPADMIGMVLERTGIDERRSEFGPSPCGGGLVELKLTSTTVDFSGATAL